MARGPPIRARRFWTRSSRVCAENGLIENKDYFLDARWAEGRYERFAAFARELVDGEARVIIVSTIAAVRAAQHATSVIPIVMTSMNDPGNGIVASLARPQQQHHRNGNPQ